MTKERVIIINFDHLILFFVGVIFLQSGLHKMDIKMYEDEIEELSKNKKGKRNSKIIEEENDEERVVIIKKNGKWIKK